MFDYGVSVTGDIMWYWVSPQKHLCQKFAHCFVTLKKRSFIMVFCVFGDVILMVDELCWSRYRFKFNVPTFRSYKFLRCPVWVSLGPWPVSPQTLWKVMPHYICWSFCLSVGLFVHLLVSLSVVLHQWIVDHGHSLHNHSERSCLIPSVGWSVCWSVLLLVSLSVCLSFLRFVSLSVDTCVPETTALASVSSM